MSHRVDTVAQFAAVIRPVDLAERSLVRISAADESTAKAGTM
jgi:hypothetical protein